MHQLLSGLAHADSKTSLQQNPPVLYWECWLTRVDLCNGYQMVMVVVVVVVGSIKSLKEMTKTSSTVTLIM